jgi:hypothetical protein
MFPADFGSLVLKLAERTGAAADDFWYSNA